MDRHEYNLQNEDDMWRDAAPRVAPTAALDAEFRKVIVAKYSTRRDGSPLHCMTCGAPLVMGQAYCATNGDGWLNFCATCAGSKTAMIAGLVGRVEALAEGVTGLDHVDQLANVNESLIDAALAGDERVFLPAKAVLIEMRNLINAARKVARDDNALDLSGVPSGTYGVPGGDTRLKVQIDNVAKGKWAGFIFVKDGAEYGQQKRYGMQKPGGTYKGEITEALRAIAGDIAGAAKAYGDLTSKCTFCGLPLEDKRSTDAGYGPTCATKYNLPWGNR